MRAVVDQTVDPVEHELLKATQFVPEKRYRKRQDYLAALMRAVCDLPDSQFDKLTDEAADWGCRAVDAFKTGGELPDFESSNGNGHDKDHESPDPVPVEEPTPEPDEDEEESDETVIEAVEAEIVHEKPAKKKPGRPKGSGAKDKAVKAVKAKVVKAKETKPKTPKVKGESPLAKIRRVGVNQWGVLRGSKSDTVCQLLSREEGATMEEIKTATGHYHYNLCNRLKRRGFDIVKDGLRIYLRSGSPSQLTQ